MVDLCAVFWGRSITRRRVAQKELKLSQREYICYLGLKVNIRFRNTDQNIPGFPKIRDKIGISRKSGFPKANDAHLFVLFRIPSSNNYNSLNLIVILIMFQNLIKIIF